MRDQLCRCSAELAQSTDRAAWPQAGTGPAPLAWPCLIICAPGLPPPRPCPTRSPHTELAAYTTEHPVYRHINMRMQVGSTAAARLLSLLLRGQRQAVRPSVT